jgi:hypothetical protein
LDARKAASLDEDLMSTHGFSLDQLMELAGLSVASATIDSYPHVRRPLIISGPGSSFLFIPCSHVVYDSLQIMAAMVLSLPDI